MHGGWRQGLLTHLFYLHTILDNGVSGMLTLLRLYGFCLSSSQVFDQRIVNFSISDKTASYTHSYSSWRALRNLHVFKKSPCFFLFLSRSVFKANLHKRYGVVYKIINLFSLIGIGAWAITSPFYTFLIVIFFSE